MSTLHECKGNELLEVSGLNFNSKNGAITAGRLSKEKHLLRPQLFLVIFFFNPKDTFSSIAAENDSHTCFKTAFLVHRESKETIRK